ncbi:MAG: hypothetical protein ABI417_13265, partial [Coleofasciculaceae cyanobacterium]
MKFTFLLGLPVILGLSSVCALAGASETNWFEVTQPRFSDSEALLQAARVFVDVNSIKRQAVTGDIKYKIKNIY